jgi:hypothetical protein
MTTPAGILNKVKFLRNLGKSSNTNEAMAANSAAEKLINKFKITDVELENMEQKPLYGSDELLYHTFSVVGWMNRLALAIAKHFDCYIVQETMTPVTGDHEYNYFVYGGEDEEEYVKFAFVSFHKKIHYLLDTKCFDRGPIYQDSYAEGIVEAIKSNIELSGIEIPEVKRPSRKIENKQITADNSKQAIVLPTKKEAPHEEKIDVKGQSLIKDIYAYYKGIIDGQALSLQDILELEVENEQAEQLKAGSTE